MIWPFSLLVRTPRQSEGARLAAEIAQRSFDLVWSRIRPTAHALRHHEARGYVRARALPVVDAQVQRCLARATAQSRAEVYQRALESVVTAVVHELSRRGWAARPQKRAA